MAKRTVNMKYQITQSIHAINYVGQSKRDARAIHEHGLHSIKMVKETLSVSQNFGKYLREIEGLRSLLHVRTEHYERYIEYKRCSGVTNGHLINIETGLRHLYKGLDVHLKKHGKEAPHFIPLKRIIAVSTREEAENRSYTEEEILTLQFYMSENAALGVELSWKCDLRLRECENLRKEHLVFQGPNMMIIFSVNNSKGVTKGGRPRVIPVTDGELEKRLINIVASKQEKDRVIGITSAAFRKALERSCKASGIVSNGWHGFRHTYARNELNRRLKTNEERYMMKRMLRNITEKGKADYGIKEHEKELYAIAKKAMDEVHALLGHGENRYALAKVYLTD